MDRRNFIWQLMLRIRCILFVFVFIPFFVFKHVKPAVCEICNCYLSFRLSVERKTFFRFHFIVSFPCSRRRKTRNGNEKTESRKGENIFAVCFLIEGQPLQLFVFVFIPFFVFKHANPQTNTEICKRLPFSRFH